MKLRKKKRPKKEAPMCSDLCEHCIYIEEGDFLCDVTNDVTIVDWKPLFCICPKKRRIHK